MPEGGRCGGRQARMTSAQGNRVMYNNYVRSDVKHTISNKSRMVEKETRSPGNGRDKRASTAEAARGARRLCGEDG